MMRDKFDLSVLEPDIVALVLKMVIEMAPGFSEAIARQIEQEVKEKHGGQRLFIPKGTKRLTAEQREAVFKDGLSNMDNDEIIKKHNISRRTIYRVMKEGGGRFGA
jgi:Mor family transcriptional regulator